MSKKCPAFKAILFIILISLSVSVSCTPSQTEEDNRLVIGIPADLETLNPILSSWELETEILNALFSTLITVDNNLNLVPNLLAEMPVVSDDGLNYAFQLKEGVTFHDGHELTAADVKFTYEMKIAEGNAVPSGGMWDLIDVFSVTDPYHFEITLKEFDTTWLENWGYADAMIVPKHIVREEFLSNGEALTKGGDFSRNPVGSGPYKFVEWKPMEYIILEKYDDYFQGKPQIDTLVWKVIPDTNTLLSQFKNGEINIYNRVEPGHYEELRDKTDIKLEKYLGFKYMHADFNLNNPVFQDKAVRQALNYAFPKDDYINTVLAGIGSAAHSYVHPLSWAYNPNVKQYGYNPAEAVRLLEEAGWLPGEDGIRVKDGVRLAFTLTTMTGVPVREAFQEIALQEWGAIGAEVTIDNVEGAAFGEVLFGGDFDIIIFTWTSGYDPDSEVLWHSGGDLNIPGYVNPHLDGLLEEGKRIRDREERKAIYFEIQEILAEDVPSMFVYYEERIDAVPGSLKNFLPNPTQVGNTWNIHAWSLM